MPTTRQQPISSITLGTAQLGTTYGIANKNGLPSDGDARTIIERALSGGISSFDTARSYGCAENRLGKALSAMPSGDYVIITKLAPMTDLAERATRAEVVTAVEASVRASCEALQREHVDVMMLHRSDDMFRASGAALDHLAKLAESGIVREIGVSVYSPEEAMKCVVDPRIEHIQIPFNLLDRRWANETFARVVGQRPDLKIHVRSVFLQGLLVSDATVWPNWMSSAARIVASISALSINLGRHKPADLCMAYVRAFPWVTTLVLGVDTQSQLEELMGFARERTLSLREVEDVHRLLHDIPGHLLDPRQW